MEEKGRKKTFKRKLLLSMIVLSFLPIFSIGLASSVLSERVIQKNYIQSQETSLNMADTAIENVIKGIVRSCRNMLANDIIMRIQGGDEGYTLENRNLLDKEMQNIFFDNPDIESVFLLHNGEEIYIYSRREKMSGIGQQFDFMELQEEEWYEEAVKANGKEVFAGYDIMNPRNEQSVSCVKMLRNLEFYKQTETEGLLVVNVEKETMFRSFLEDEKTESSYLVYQDKPRRRIVFTDLNEDLDKEKLVDSFYENQEGSVFDDCVISMKRNKSTQWKIINLIGEAQLFQESRNLKAMILWVSAGTGAVMVILFLTLSKSLYRPLMHLEESIIKATPELSGESLRRVQDELAGRSFSDDEFGVVERRFQEMLIKNRELNERILQQQIYQKNSQIRDLQAKINPHFLYNILDCIYWMIGMEKKKEAGKMIISLSRIMRNSLNQGKEITTLSKEFVLLKDYLLLQSMRYEERFSYQVTLEQGLEELPMLNLMLQPFVENSVMHGLEPKIGGGYVHVTGKYEEPWVIIRISDNGIGMSEETMRNPGYGIRNVRKRLELFYGDSYELKIYSKEQVGTTVVIKLLLEKFKEEGENV